MAAATRELSSEIRKLRKKLRQIENLERSTRDLSEEEELKVARKLDIRATLLELLTEQGEVTQSTCNDGDITVESDPSFTSVRESEASYQLQAESTPEQSTNDYDSAIPPQNQCIDDNNSAVPPKNTCNSQADRQSGTQSAALQPQEIVQHENSEWKEHKPPQGQEKAKKHKVTPASTLDSERRLWRSSQFKVDLLEGHSDLITAVDTDGQIVVSASRDTTVKVWDVESSQETRNLGGHTNAVTCVHLLSLHLSPKLCDMLDTPTPGDQYVLSGSLDCSIRVWSLLTGQTVRRVYTFDPVTRLQYSAEPPAVITGSDGGKISMWDLSSGEAIHSVCALQGAVSALQVAGQRLYTASEDGVVKVHLIRQQSLSCVFVSESLHKSDSSPVTLRCIRDLAVVDDRIVFGDDRENLKILTWKTGTLSKLHNNLSEFGSTDAVCCHGNLLLASGYDLDNGLGFINVRTSDENAEYLSTLSDDDTGRIVCIACCRADQGPVKQLIVSGGQELKMWKRVTGAAVDSDTASDSDGTDSDEGGRSAQTLGRKRLSLGSLNEAGDKGWLGWCSVL